MRCAMQSTRACAPTWRASALRAPSTSRSARLVVKAGLLDFLQLPGGNKAPGKDQRARVLVNELLGVASGTAAGTKASAERREQIEELVAELKQFSVRNASRSKLLFGDYEVLYISSPGSPGSPLLGPSGVVPLGANVPVEILEEDGAFTSKVEFKSLGFLGGQLKRSGTIRPAGADSYQLDVNEVTYQAGLGGASTKEVDESYSVQLLYLGEELRVVEVTAEDEEDGVLIVLKRAGVEVEEEEEEEDEQEVQQRAPASAGLGGLFGGSKAAQPGLATLSERQVRRQMEMEQAKRSGGTGVKAVSGTGKVAAGTGKIAAGTGKIAVAAKEGTGKVGIGARAAAAAPVVDAKAARDRAAADKKAEAERKAAAEKRAEADRKAEAEKRASAERQGAIKELLASLTEALKGRQAETKEAAAELKDAERSGAAALKKASAASSTVSKAEAEVEETEEALAEAVAARKEAEAKLKEAQAALNQANTKLAALTKSSRA